MSCEACSFPYSLCQCPAVITVGELAILRINLRTAQRQVGLLTSELAGARTDAATQFEERMMLMAELEVLRANLAASPVRVVTLTPVHCAVDDCDQEPDSTGFCERHRKATP